MKIIQVDTTPENKILKQLYSLNQDNVPNLGSLSSELELAKLIKLSHICIYVLSADEIAQRYGSTATNLPGASSLGATPLEPTGLDCRHPQAAAPLSTCGAACAAYRGRHACNGYESEGPPHFVHFRTLKDTAKTTPECFSS